MNIRRSQSHKCSPSQVTFCLDLRREAVTVTRITLVTYMFTSHVFMLSVSSAASKTCVAWYFIDTL